MKNNVRIFSANTAEELEGKINSFFSYIEKTEGFLLFHLKDIQYRYNVDSDGEYFSVLIFYTMGIGD